MNKNEISMQKITFYVTVILFIIYQGAYAIGQFVGNVEKLN